jgi:hypothetical protein
MKTPIITTHESHLAANEWQKLKNREESVVMKTKIEAAIFVDRFFSNLSEREVFPSMPQEQPVVSVFAANWALNKTLRVSQHRRNRLTEKYPRPLKIVESRKEPEAQEEADPLTGVLSENSGRS